MNIPERIWVSEYTWDSWPVENTIEYIRAPIWWSVDDGLPNTRLYCLCVWEYEGARVVGEAHYDDGWAFPVYGDTKDVISIYPKVTHWMPLPEPPEENE